LYSRGAALTLISGTPSCFDGCVMGIPRQRPESVMRRGRLVRIERVHNSLSSWWLFNAVLGPLLCVEYHASRGTVSYILNGKREPLQICRLIMDNRITLSEINTEWVLRPRSIDLDALIESSSRFHLKHFMVRCLLRSRNSHL
jgi:hypothetical protein